MMNLSSLIDQGVGTPPFQWMFYIGLPAAFLLSRVLLVAVVGFLGMILETILILYYQAKHGGLYQDIGILLMSFMAGLALGSLTIHRWLVGLTGQRKPVRWYGVGLLVGVGLLALIITTTITQSALSGLIPTVLLLVAAGFFVAGLFAYVNLYEIQDQKAMISSLYAADLIGGCAGTLLAGLILIPLAGLDVTTGAMVALALFSILLV
jgi:hypothetical protein